MLRREFQTGAWAIWPEPIRRRRPEALAKVAAQARPRPGSGAGAAICLSTQWNELRKLRACNAIRVLGDVAIFVNMDSADVWVHPEIFELDEELKPTRSPVCRPITFPPQASAGETRSIAGMCWRSGDLTGGLIASAAPAELYDIVRLDHFRGFEAYWVDPRRGRDGGERRVGEGAGTRALPRTRSVHLGPLPLVAEDLGLITPEVDALRHGAGNAGNEGAAVRIQQQGRAHPPAAAF